MAAPTQAAPPAKGPFLKNSIIWEKKGPLPVWAWALIVLGLVLAVTMWRKNKAASDTTTTDVGNVPANQAAPPIFIMPQGPAPNVTVTVPAAPPGAGRPGPPRNPKPPTSFRQEDDPPVWPDAVRLSWDPVPGATGYAIKDIGSGKVTPVGAVDSTMITGLIHNGSYFFQIAAKNAQGALGPYSEQIKAHTRN